MAFNGGGILEWPKQRRHFSLRAPSETSTQYKPRARVIEEKTPRASGLRQVPAYRPTEKSLPQARHFPEKYHLGGTEVGLYLGTKVKVRDDQGERVCYKQSETESMKKVLGTKKKISNIIDKRNGIEYKRPGDKLYAAPEYTTDFFINSAHGGGVIPGSNFGFSRATQTTKESVKVFGKSIQELWAKNPQIPHVLRSCIHYLTHPDRIANSKALYKENADTDIEVHHLDDDVPSPQVMKEIRKLRSQFNGGHSNFVHFENSDAVLGLLVQYLKEMSPPLLTYDLYDKFMDSQSHPKPASRVGALRPTLAKLPQANETVFHALVSYLYQLVGIVGSTAIAKKFAPVLLRSDPLIPVTDRNFHESSLETIKEKVVICMLDNAKHVFPSSVLVAKNAHNKKIPFTVKRQMQLAIENFDQIMNLDAWEDQANISSGMSTASLDRKLEAFDNLEGKEDELDQEELEEIRALKIGYKNHFK